MDRYSTVRRRYAGLMLAVLLNAETLNGSEPKTQCGIQITIYRFSAEPGTTLSYAGKKHTVGAAGTLELLAVKGHDTYQVRSREYRLRGDADEFGIVTVRVERETIKGVPDDLAHLVLEAARAYQLDPVLITAVVRRESNFRRNAESRVGARGLMQLMPATAEWLGVRDAWDPRQNIMGGTKYLRMLHDMFDGDLSLTLAAYNAGPGNVRKHKGIPPFAETRAYVAAIRTEYEAALR